MKRMLLTALFGAVLLTGCARHYVITLNSGARITTRGKPKQDGGSYVYRDATGQLARVPKGSVREISPASMVTEQKSPFLSQPQR